MESTDCGAVCLQMLCAFYGKPISLQYIKEGLSISRIGITIRDVKTRATELGLNTIVAKATLQQIVKMQSPVILHWNNNHFVVLYKVKKERGDTYSYYIADPANGKIKFTEKEIKRYWLEEKEDGIVILTQPTIFFYETSFPKQKNDWSIAVSLLKKYVTSKTKIYKSLVLLIISMLCSWMIPYLYQSIIDKGVVEKNLHTILRLSLVQLSFFLGYILSNTFSSIILSKVNFNIGIEYVGELLEKIMRLPMKCFDTKLNTEFIQRLDDFNRIRFFLTENVINIVYYLINAVVYFVLLSYYNWKAVIVFVVMSLIVFLWDSYFLHERKFIDYSLFNASAKNRNLLYELVNNMPDIKINNAQKKENIKWQQNQKYINDLMIRQMSLNYKQNVGRNTINRLRDIAILCYCCIIAINGDITIGMLMSISYLLGQLGGPIEQIQNLVTQYQMFKVHLARLSEVQQKEEETVNASKEIEMIKYGIAIKNITFKYEGSFNTNIFENLSITFPCNKTTAIVGNSGSGKTTLIKLILGFYFPQHGEIEIDNISITQVGINSWRKLCGVVLQDGKIFSGTIAENITLGSDIIDERRIESVSKLACIDEFIQKQPGKYMMRIGSTGIELSQGQKQRLLIARALYKDPQLLIFDEATSALDTINERCIMNNLNGFFKNRTVIVVAHRLSTVVNADNIIFRDNGVIAEQGTHKDLVKKRGKYYELIKNQLELEK